MSDQTGRSKGKPMSTGFDGMSEELARITNGMMRMRERGSNFMTMYHIEGVKVADGNMPAGGTAIVAMDNRNVWMPTAVMLAQKYGGADWAALISDAFIRVFDGDDDGDLPDQIGPGDLEKMREAGDMKVVDAMTTVLVHHDGTKEQCHVKYWLDETGALTWAEPEWFTEDDDVHGEGYVSDCLEVLVGFRIPKTREIFDALDRLGSMQIDEIHTEDA